MSCCCCFENNFIIETTSYIHICELSKNTETESMIWASVCLQRKRRHKLGLYSKAVNLLKYYCLYARLSNLSQILFPLLANAHYQIQAFLLSFIPLSLHGICVYARVPMCACVCVRVRVRACVCTSFPTTSEQRLDSFE